MRIINLFEKRINSATELKDAFSEQEWVNIAYYFTTQKNGETDNTKFRSQNYRFQRNLGNQMPNNVTADSWNLKASRFGARVDGAATWTSIYNHLAPHANTETPFNDVSPVSQAMSPHDNTRETKSQVSNWVNTNTSEWTDFSKFRKEFWNPWFSKLKEARADFVDEDGRDWWDNTFYRKYNGQFVPRRQEIDRIYQEYQTKTPIVKDDVINDLWVWLLGSDDIFAQRVERQRNR